MRLNDIGFYTLSDERARTASWNSPMCRAEIILMSGCNFRCGYCREMRQDVQGVMPLDRVKQIIDHLALEGLENIRFSGGEPTLYPSLREAVAHVRERGIKRIALSTNGSAPTAIYRGLVDAGVNDFSVSLDACCSNTGDNMAGGIRGAWDTVVANIRELAKISYTTVGIVLTKENLVEARDTILLAHSLGVADIRVITAAQEDLTVSFSLPEEVLAAHPILRYRWTNIGKRNMRGLRTTDCRRCPLVQDDTAIAGNAHFPCIIYLRERGEPIGEINPGMRTERVKWFASHDTYIDPICRSNCLDVCIDYNNRWTTFNEDQ